MTATISLVERHPSRRFAGRRESADRIDRRAQRPDRRAAARADTAAAATGRAPPRRRPRQGPNRIWPGSVRWSGGWRRCRSRCGRAGRTLTALRTPDPGGVDAGGRVGRDGVRRRHRAPDGRQLVDDTGAGRGVHHDVEGHADPVRRGRPVGGTGAAITAFGPAPQTPPPDFTWTEEDLYDGDPSGEDINQDEIGDCYLMATMGAVADADPQRDQGPHQLQPGHRRVRRDVVGRQAVAARPRHPGRHRREHRRRRRQRRRQLPGAGKPLWPAVLESAYAKMGTGQGSERHRERPMPRTRWRH